MIVHAALLRHPLQCDGTFFDQRPWATDVTHAVCRRRDYNIVPQSRHWVKA